MSKPKKRTHRKKAHVDSGYPFETGDWEKWSNRRRLDWMVNFRDKLRDKYKDTLNVTDDQIEELTAQIVPMQKIVDIEESNPQLASDFNDKPPRERIRLIRDWVDDLTANGSEKANIIGWTLQVLNKYSNDIDAYEAQIADWEHKREMAISFPYASIDDDIIPTAFSEALTSGDIVAIKREYAKWKAAMDKKEQTDPAFAAYMEKIRAEAERKTWADTIDGDDILGRKKK